MEKSDKDQVSWINNHELKVNLKFIDLLYIFFRYKKPLLITTFIIGVITAIYAWFFMTIIFEANAVILLTPQKSGGISGLMADVDLPIDVGGLGKSSLEGNKMLAILNSRRLLYSVIDHFDLRNVYKMKYYHETEKTLRKNLKFDFNKENQTITITAYYEEDTIKCVEITNFIIDKLDEINKELSLEKATAYRKFIERRYRQNLEDIRMAEDTLLRFQKIHGLFAIDEQTKATIATIAELETQTIAAEIEYNFLTASLSRDHPEVLRAAQKMKEIQKQKEKIQTTGGGSHIIVPLQKGPDLALEYYRLKKNLEIQTKIQVFLLPQYEQAKLQEAKDTPTLQVIDRAVKPEKRAKPKRTIFTLTVVFTSFSLLFGFFLIKDRILINLGKPDTTDRQRYVHNEIHRLWRLFSRQKTL